MSTRAAYRFLLPALFALLALFPPEARGESLAGCALLIVLLPWLSWRQRPTPALLGGLCVVLAASWPLALASAAPGSSVAPLSVLVLALVAGTYTAAFPEHLRGGGRIPWWLAVAATVAAIHGLVQVLGGLEHAARALENAPLPDREAALARLQGGRAFAGFPTPAAMGGFLALALPVSVGLGLGCRGKARAAAWSLSAVQVAGIVATRSVTAAGALVVALAVFLLSRTRRRGVWLASLAAAALILVAVVGLRGGELVGSDTPGHPIRLRAGNARIALAMATDHPWLGVGPGAYGEVYPAYRGPRDNESRHAHNVALELAAEYGFPLGGTLAALFFVVFLGPALRRARAGPAWRDGAAVGLAAFALQNLADFTSFLPSVLWTAALLRGLAEEGPDGAPARQPGWALAPALAVALGAVGFAALAVGTGIGWNERTLARDALARGESTAAVASARRSVRWAPWNPDGRLVLVRALLEQGAERSEVPEVRAEALAHAEAAVRLSPVRPAARQVRGRIREAAGDRAGAWTDLAFAAERNPWRPEYVRDRDRLKAGLAPAPPPPETGP